MTTRAFAMTLARPHEALGLPQPLGRRLPKGVVAWNVALLVCTAVSVLGYVLTVNSATEKGYSLRVVQRNVDSLRTETMMMQDKLVGQSSLEALSERASALGFQQPDHIVYLNPVVSSYAVAR